MLGLLSGTWQLLVKFRGYNAEAYLGPRQTSMIKLFGKNVNPLSANAALIIETNWFAQ